MIRSYGEPRWRRLRCPSRAQGSAVREASGGPGFDRGDAGRPELDGGDASRPELDGGDAGRPELDGGDASRPELDRAATPRVAASLGRSTVRPPVARAQAA